jgi:exodeoxyribonuclease VIII
MTDEGPKTDVRWRALDNGANGAVPASIDADARWPLPSQLAPGFYEALPPESYYAPELGMVSKSALDLLAKSPATYKAWVDGRRDTFEKEAFLIGKAFDTAVLEPTRFDREYALQPDYGDCSLKGPKDARARWRVQHAEQTRLDPKQGALVLAMADSVRNNVDRVLGEKLRTILGMPGIAQPTLRWDDPVTGLPCKARPDWYVPGLQLLFDLKTTTDASWSGFRRAAKTYGYDRQAAEYIDGMAAVGRPVDDLVFICVEKEAPYNVGVWPLTPASLIEGREKMGALKALLLRCLTEDYWPSFLDNGRPVDTTTWGRR